VPKLSPTQRSLALLRDEGYSPFIVEHWNPFAKIRQDLFGFVDILALRKGEVLGVQTTSRNNVAARIQKIANHKNVGIVRDSGVRIEVHGWDGDKLRREDIS